MSGLVDTNRILKGCEEELGRKELIKRAILGMFVGMCLILIFLLGYRLGGQFQTAIVHKVAWNLQLVNTRYTVPEDYNVELALLENGHAVDKRIYNDLQSMMNEARAAGLSPLICSSYRSHEEQIDLFNKEMNKYIAQGYSKKEATDRAAKWIAKPGTSEHEIGLAVDIVAKDYQILDVSQEQTPEQQWLMANSYKYGFILRYSKYKSEATGKSYEPWHYRYVGKAVARIITEKKLCLEEYLE